MRLRARVAPLVCEQRATQSEALPAGVADEGPVTTVHRGMRLQVSSLCEAAATHAAAERTAARVDEAVAPQVGRHTEAPPAGVAAEGLFAGVHAAVHRQSAAAGEAAATPFTGMRPLTAVRPLVGR